MGGSNITTARRSAGGGAAPAALALALALVGAPAPAARDTPKAPSPLATAQVLELLAALQEAPAAGRAALQPRATAALKRYAKLGEGSREEFARFETAYRQLAERVAAAYPETDAAALAATVRARAERRLRYLADPKALAADAQQAWHQLLALQYDRCSRLCADILDGAYDRTPAVELAVGVCALRGADPERALRQFHEVLRLKGAGQTQIAPLAAFLAANALLSAGRPDAAVRLLRALESDYPASRVADRAAAMGDRLQAMIRRAAEPDAKPTKRPVPEHTPRPRTPRTQGQCLRLLTKLLATPPPPPPDPPGRETP